MTATQIALSAHLLTARADYRGAGINGYLYQLLLALPDADPALCYTVYTAHDVAPPPHERLRSVPTAWDSGRPLRRILWEQAAQPVALRRQAPDLLHALAFVTPVLSRVPSVVTVYDLSFIHYPETLPAARRLYLRLFTRRSCLHARRVIAISHSTARDLTATYGIPAAKIDVALPGVSPAFHPLPTYEVESFRWRQNLPEHFLLFLGTLEPRKNLVMLLRAYAGLPARDRAAAHLVLAGGKGWMYEDIFRAIETLNLGETVHLPGYLPAEELPLWYNAADAFVFPSLFEGFGLPVVEALACGTPVLVSEVSSLPEAAGEAGCLLPPHDIAAWTEALARAIHDPAWREDAGQRGLTVAARFTWAQTAAQTVASYHRALEGEPESRG